MNKSLIQMSCKSGALCILFCDSRNSVGQPDTTLADGVSQGFERGTGFFARRKRLINTNTETCGKELKLDYYFIILSISIYLFSRLFLMIHFTSKLDGNAYVYEERGSSFTLMILYIDVTLNFQARYS